jgi:hypothetical protein
MLVDTRPGCEARPGKYAVTVRIVGVVQGDQIFPQQELDAIMMGLKEGEFRVPPAYRDKQRSPLKVEVHMGDNDFKFDLKSKP